MPVSFRNITSKRYVQWLLVLLTVACCVLAIRAAGRYGASRLFVKYALATRNLTVAEGATRLTPADPQAHRARGAVLSWMDSRSEALSELEQAAALRPADFSPWISLGLMREQAGDRAGAVAALNEAVARAPFYAQPRWQRGNVLLRAGQYQEAFQDLNYAAKSNPDLLPNLIDLAWNLSKSDPVATEQMVLLDTPKMRSVYARYLAKQGKPTEAVAQFKAAGIVPQDVREELVQQLLAKSAFVEAFEIWSMGGTGNEKSTMYDGGFEDSLILQEAAFGWRLPGNGAGASLSQDPAQPHSGSKSLRIDFDGNSSPASPLILQLIVLAPVRRYQVNFAFRSQNLVTGGLPIVVVSDAGDGKRLGQSTPLLKDSDWRVVSFEFTAAATTTAIHVTLQRENCTSSPCPIFGALTLDSFSLQSLN